MVPRKKGSIIFIASIAGLRPDPLLGAYSGTINDPSRLAADSALHCDLQRKLCVIRINLYLQPWHSEQRLTTLHQCRRPPCWACLAAWPLTLLVTTSALMPFVLEWYASRCWPLSREIT